MLLHSLEVIKLEKDGSIDIITFSIILGEF